MQIPPYLKQGDTIGLTCTARSISLEELQPAIKLIESWGFKVKIGSSIGLIDRQFGGTDKERGKSFQELLDDKNVKAIWICRGGYGSLRVLDYLDFTTFKDHPKWLIGFSDVTVLHSYIQQQLGYASLHATMPSYFNLTDSNCISLIPKILSGDKVRYDIPPHQFNKTGTCKGQIVGGNLSLIYAMLGTSEDIDTNGKILFIEDLDEYLYHIDRMMLALKRANKLEKLAGLIIGGMNDMNDNETPFGKNALEIIAEHIEEFNYPVCFDFPVGHIMNNKPIVLGNISHLTVDIDSVLFKQ